MDTLQGFCNNNIKQKRARNHLALILTSMVEKLNDTE